ncbi:MAG: hypothetical protein WD359_06520, partial [Dehalococcoidia bacterium]
FPCYVQVSPPETVDDAKALVRSFGTAGADGLILTYAEGVPDGFLRTADAAKALIELAAVYA